MFELKTTGLFIATAIKEIVGCYLPYLWLKKGVWLGSTSPWRSATPWDWLGVAVTLTGMAIIMFAPRHA